MDSDATTGSSPAEGLPADAGLAALRRALDAAPYDASLHRALAQAMAGDDALSAEVHRVTAQLIEGYLDGSQPGAAVDLCNIATAYFSRGNYAAAEVWYRIVIALDPDIAVAYMNLVPIYQAMGRQSAAERCRERAYRIQRVFVEREGDPAYRVLVLNSGRSAANVPVDVPLPTARYERINYIIDYAGEDEDEALPAFDFIFNAVGEADVASALLCRLDRFAARSARPLLNAPAAVALTQRHRLASLLGDIANVVAAPCLRLDAPPSDAATLLLTLGDAGMDFPLLVRPTGSHGGAGLVLCTDVIELGAALRAIDGGLYLTRFVDYRSADGYYRKYRMIYVGREAHPYHLAISPNWMVHYESSGMEDDAARIAEERAFLSDPEAALGAAAMAAIREIGKHLGLDYAGVDFALLSDGRVLVFEANATMLVHYEREDGPLAHKNPHVRAIAGAFERMVEGLAAK
jgi:tetratricopeptide (TPR) repeat protein